MANMAGIIRNNEANMRIRSLSMFIAGMLSGFANAQGTSRGGQEEPLTLSDGRYPEVVISDVLRKVGSFGFNAVTGQAYYLGGNCTGHGEARVGRWLSLDPLAKKYPELSPYAFTANNPVLYVDHDGRDYGVYIDHATKTIIIKQTFYATKEHAAEAREAAMGWTALNGQYEYVVGSGENAESYSISFQIDVVEKADYSERDEAWYEDGSGEANTYQIVAEGTLGGDRGHTANDPNVGRGASQVAVEPGTQKDWKTGKHEIGHTLGIGHWFKGIMKRGATRQPNETEVTTGMVSKILANAGIGTQVVKGLDYEKEASEGKADATVHEEGTAPADFSTGKVQEVKH